MSTVAQTSLRFETQPRFVILGELASGKRVLDIGSSDMAGMGILMEAGARKVTCACDDTMKARRHSPRGVDIVEEPTLPLSFDDNAFDLIICHDLPDRMAEDEQWLVELRRILSDDGFLVAGVAQSDGQFVSELAGTRFGSGMSYEDVYGTVAEIFGEVSVYGQSPVVATLFYDFEADDDEAGLDLDRSMVTDDDEPGWYLLVFGPEGVPRPDLTLVQHNFTDVVSVVEESFTADGDEEYEEVVEEVEIPVTASDDDRTEGEIVANLEARISELEGKLERKGRELDTQQRQQRQHETVAQEAHKEVAKLTQQLEALQQQGDEPASSQELEHALGVIRQQEETIRGTFARARELEELWVRERYTQEQTEAQRLAAQARAQEVRESLEAMEEKWHATERELADAFAASSASTREIAELKEKLGVAEQEAHEQADELIKTMEEQLQTARQESEERAAKEREESEKKIEQLQEELAARGKNYNSELERLHSELGSLTSTLQKHEEQEIERQQKLEIAQAHLEVLENEKAQLLAESNTLSAHAQDQYDAVQKELRQAKEQATAAEELLARAETQQSQIVAERDALADKLSEAHEALKETKEELDGARSQRDEASALAATQTEELQEALQSTRQELQAAQEQLRTAQEELESTQTQLQQAREETASVQQDQDQLQGQLQELQALQSQVGTLESDLDQTSRQRDELQSVLVAAEERHKTDVSDLQDQLQEAQGRYKSLEAERENLAQEAQRLTDRLHDLEHNATEQGVEAPRDPEKPVVSSAGSDLDALVEHVPPNGVSMPPPPPPDASAASDDLAMEVELPSEDHSPEQAADETTSAAPPPPPEDVDRENSGDDDGIDIVETDELSMADSGASPPPPPEDEGDERPKDSIELDSLLEDSSLGQH